MNKPLYKNSALTPPNVSQEVFVSVDDFRRHFPGGGEVQMTYLGFTNGGQRWNHDTVGILFGSRLWRPYVEEVKPVWIDSRKEKPVAESLPVWITHGPGEEVRAATYTCWYHHSGGKGHGWLVGGTTFIDPFFWQPREVPVEPKRPEPMPEPVRTDGWIRLGATKPADEQQVWVATVNMGVQPARFFTALVLTDIPARFVVCSGPEVGQTYVGNFLLWQPRQAQPAYPIL